MKPKYTVEQILEAVEASHLPLFVVCVNEEKVEVGNTCVDTTLTVISNADGLLALNHPDKEYTEVEKVVLVSLETALHILFNSNEVIY